MRVSRAHKALHSGRLLSVCMQAKDHSTQAKSTQGAQPELSIHCHFDDCCKMQHFARETVGTGAVALCCSSTAALHAAAAKSY